MPRVVCGVAVVVFHPRSAAARTVGTRRVRGYGGALRDDLALGHSAAAKYAGHLLSRSVHQGPPLVAPALRREEKKSVAWRSPLTVQHFNLFWCERVLFGETLEPRTVSAKEREKERKVTK